jgi:hypothetical protein
LERQRLCEPTKEALADEGGEKCSKILENQHSTLLFLENLIIFCGGACGY